MRSKGRDHARLVRGGVTERKSDVQDSPSLAMPIVRKVISKGLRCVEVPPPRQTGRVKTTRRIEVPRRTKGATRRLTEWTALRIGLTVMIARLRASTVRATQEDDPWEKDLRVKVAVKPRRGVRSRTLCAQRTLGCTRRFCRRETGTS